MWLKQTAPASTIDIYTVHVNNNIIVHWNTRTALKITGLSHDLMWQRRRSAGGTGCQSEKSARPSRYYWGYVRVSLRRRRQQLFTLVELAVTVTPRHQLSWPRAVLVVTWQTAVSGLTFYHNMRCGGLSGAAPQLAADSSTAGVRFNNQSALITRYSLISPFYITNNEFKQPNCQNHKIICLHTTP